MGEVNKILDLLSMSQKKMTEITSEIPILEKELKHLEDKENSLKIKKVQIEKDLKYKRETIDGKTIELDLKKNSHKVWEEIYISKQNNLLQKNDELELIKEKIYNLRIEFSENVSTFLDENDLLITSRNKIQNTIKIMEDKHLLDNEIKELEMEILELRTKLNTKDYCDKKIQLESMENEKLDLEKEWEKLCEIMKRINDIDHKCLQEHPSMNSEQYFMEESEQLPDSLGGHKLIQSGDEDDSGDNDDNGNNYEFEKKVNAPSKVHQAKGKKCYFIPIAQNAFRK